MPHVMIVSDRTDANGVSLVIHNIGEGVKEGPYLLVNKVASQLGHLPCLMPFSSFRGRLALKIGRTGGVRTRDPNIKSAVQFPRFVLYLRVSFAL